MGDFRKPRVAEYGMYGAWMYTWMYGHGMYTWMYGHGLRYVFMRHIVDGAIRMSMNLYPGTFGRDGDEAVYKHYIYPSLLILNSSSSFPRLYLYSRAPQIFITWHTYIG